MSGSDTKGVPSTLPPLRRYARLEAMELARRVLSAEILDPRYGFERRVVPVEVRWDPLTGQASRVLPERGLMPRSDTDLEELARETAERCPFCAARIDEQTPRFPPAVSADGRFRRGSAVCVPNLFPYSRFSSVTVYGPELHYLPLAAMTEDLVADNLAAQVAFVRAAMTSDPEAHWASINANHMLPSGSSLFHPHTQGSVDPVPTTMQRLLAETPPERFDAYLAAERAAGARDLGSSGRVEWLASFAPLAPCELRAFVPGVASPAQLDDVLVRELGAGIARALNLYAEMGFESFNMAMYAAPRGTAGRPLNLRLACRSNPRSHYRSDATYFERLHWEAAVDIAPEEVAERAGDRFRR
jgi:galactose-1-phosphate uridylyltransferase